MSGWVPAAQGGSLRIVLQLLVGPARVACHRTGRSQDALGPSGASSKTHTWTAAQWGSVKAPVQGWAATGTCRLWRAWHRGAGGDPRITSEQELGRGASRGPHPQEAGRVRHALLRPCLSCLWSRLCGCRVRRNTQTGTNFEITGRPRGVRMN